MADDRVPDPAAGDETVLNARFVVHVQPRARRTEVAGRHGDAIRIRLASPPVDGAANEELVRFLAETLGVPKRVVHIAAGLTSRRKTIAIDGLGAETATARLAPA